MRWYYNDYRVVWICVLLIELVVVEVMFDWYYDFFLLINNDNNYYIFGSVVEYNVVIVCFLKGVYGIWSVVYVVSDV